ncbi:hypothetical protein EW146_g7200 [Bondarzewia mesenterica]|uniref:Uncharacterized protein n=1 Tax=Bondarzewia mesenterica TaxID=1095465 RepID=A0A4S4LLH9_9AGAM|nr:hypothetical protein EW146_g7200 [Bondarzewia mesenterica]
MLLSALFLSSCYWQPVPLDAPLAHPWSENTTTFSDALTALSVPESGRPSVIRVLDRCWCDLSSANLFEPFDTVKWERTSVELVKQEMERKEREARKVTAGDAEEEEIQEGQDAKDSPEAVLPEPLEESAGAEAGATPANQSQGDETVRRKGIWSMLTSWSIPESTVQLPSNTSEHEPLSELKENDASVAEPSSAPESVLQKQPLLRRQYDLRPYGFAMILDFGWSRQSD